MYFPPTPSEFNLTGRRTNRVKRKRPEASAQQHVDFYNNMPIYHPGQRGQSRSFCPCCKVPLTAALNSEGEVFIKCDHKPDCKKWNKQKGTNMNDNEKGGWLFEIALLVLAVGILTFWFW